MHHRFYSPYVACMFDYELCDAVREWHVSQIIVYKDNALKAKKEILWYNNKNTACCHLDKPFASK